MNSKIFKSIQVLMLVIALISLFLPYLHRLNIRGGNPNISKIENGYMFLSALITIIFMTLTFYLKEKVKNLYLNFSLTTILCLSVYLIRIMIHFQGIDHDYDTKSGIGFITLTISSLLFSLTIIIETLTDSKNRQKSEIERQT